MKATVFLGGGRITSALASGLRLAKYDAPVVVYDRHPQKLRQLKKLYGVDTERDLHRAVERAKLLVIAVRPASVDALLREIGKIDCPLAAVSLAAGIPLANLRSALGPQVRWARAMPSPACRSRRGLTALVFDRSFPVAAKREVKALFAKVGTVLEIPDGKFDAFTATHSCSHGYHALATLASEARKLGLDRRTALTAAAHALADGIVAWREGSIGLETLLDEAATPGGIAAATQKAVDRAGYSRAVAAGLAAGMNRARRNAKLA
jgi:pyrroline-5-carboxylate reductase